MPGLEDDNKELLLGVQEGLEDDHKELLLGIQEEDTESPVETVRSYSQTRLGMLGRTFSTHNLFGALDEWSRGVRIPETPSEHLENSTRIKAEILRAETKKLNFVDDRMSPYIHE
mmetsp:Transcript_22685/g.31644  ORF Transcript_22685/g.31644 Transcript_22685/m.31644 type:complete len:115 (+) Transcript_22685:38-382(+)